MNSHIHPNKKPRLENCLDDFDQDAIGNDDLWDQGELTAEEFDMLEVQATQKVMQNVPPNPKTARSNFNHEINNHDDGRKEHYALQGQVKLLSESLDKTVRELNVERLNREQLITQKIEEFKNSEHRLQKEVEKIQTALQFREQEMKASQNKVHVLEQKVKDLLSTKESAMHHPNCLPPKNGPHKFLDRFNFEKRSSSRKDSSAQTNEPASDLTKYKLQLISPQGKPGVGDLTSSFLTNRRKIHGSKEEVDSQDHWNHSSHLSNSPETPFVAFARFNCGRTTHELCEYYNTTFKEHISFLQKVASLTHGKNSYFVNKIKLPLNGYDSSSSFAIQQSTLGDEIEMQHSTITACLKDLHELHPPFDNKSVSTNVQEQNEQILKWLAEPEISAYSNPLFSEEEKNESSEQSAPSCLQSLILLARPDTYPDCYKYKAREMHLALSALSEWSARMKISLDLVVYNLPLQALVSGHHGSRCALLTLRLLFRLVPLKSFQLLVHHNECCIFTSVANLCQAASSTNKNEYVEVVAAVESFLAKAISVLGTKVMIEENCSCPSQIVQGYVIMLWRYHDMCFKTAYSSPLQVDVLHRGTVLLHLLCSKMLDFREKRLPVEDQYVTLICGLSKLSKQNLEFKNLVDAIHDLWDFQDICDDTDEHSGD